MLWWKEFLRSSGGTGFWHETYFMRGGMEAIYDDIPKPVGFSAFATVKQARGPMFSSRTRLKTGGAKRKPHRSTRPTSTMTPIHQPATRS